MSQRLTYSDIKNSRIPSLCGYNPDDPRLLQNCNSFQERAWGLGRWWGTTALLRFCIRDSCITLPRQVAVVEQAKLNDNPIRTHNAWYEFVRFHQTCDAHGMWDLSTAPNFGGGCGCCGCGHVNAEDVDSVCSFSSTLGSNCKIRSYLGNISDAGKKITFQGYDKNGIWVKTSPGGVFQDGETVTLASPFVNTVTVWGPGSPVAVRKDTTNTRVLVYSVDATTGLNEIQLADYQSDETKPMYRRLRINGMPRQTNPACVSTLLCIVSLQHIPIVNDNDWLLFQNLPSYEDGVRAVKFREDGNVAEADAFMFGTQKPSQSSRGASRIINCSGAIPLLQQELQKMTGQKTTVRSNHTGVLLVGFM